MKFSGETWVGNLYEKFEAVCHEVDGLVSQEHIKNFESHVQSVGDNVMKLCSNVKDLLPSSLGVPVELKAKSVSGDVVCDANASQILPEMDVTDSLRSNETHDQVSDEDLLEAREKPSSSPLEIPFGQNESRVISEDYDGEKQSPEVSEQNFDSFTKEKQPSSCGSEVTHSGSTLINSNSGLATKEEEESLSNFRESTFPDERLCKGAITVFCDQNHFLPDQVPALVKLASLELSRRCEADFFLNKSRTSNWSVIEIGAPSDEKAEDVDSGSSASTGFLDDEGFKPKQMEFSVRFEGSCCVFVDTDNFQADHERAHTRKKRVKGSFSRRKKVLEKEYKQLGLWYGDIDAELDDCSRQKLISPIHNNNHLEESEWELL